ncbi:MAG TPA: MnhB domain-containing protein [Bacteroidota bacterium]|nr:MnhB domain-containing protein [Bacteroidota bacterium]
MNSVILRIGARALATLMLLSAIVLLLRGHNAPGGGFIAGLMAAATVTLVAMAEGLAVAQRQLRISPRLLSSLGILVAIGSGLPALASGRPFMSGEWAVLVLPLLGSVPLGTPLLFDIGVFFTVIGFTLTIFFTLAEFNEKR